MTMLERNPEACRLIDRITLLLREFVRQGLRVTHGEKWEDAGIPDELRGFLVQRRSREQSINWSLPPSLSVLDYAGFVDLFDIIVADPPLLAAFVPMGLDQQLLRMRFLEFETLRNRIAYSRPVSDAEIASLAAFEARLASVVSAISEAGSVVTGAFEPKPEQTAPAPPPPAPVSAAAPRIEAAVPAKPASTGPGAAKGGTAERAPSARPPAPPALSSADLDAALTRADDAVVLSALYHEVTELADRMWNGAVSSAGCRVWEKVRESSWYSQKFSKLGLKVLSDFYGLHDSALELAGSGSNHQELQVYLREHNFAPLLMSLRDFFSKVSK